MIDGQPRLTIAVYRQFKGKPLVFSSNPKILHGEDVPAYHFSSVYLARHCKDWMDAATALKVISPKSFGKRLKDGLIFWSLVPAKGVLRLFGKWKWKPRLAGLSFWLGRKRVVVSTGCHSTLWGQDHAPVGTPGSQILDDKAVRYLGSYQGARRYTQYLHDALEAMGDLEFCWLADAMPQWRPKVTAHPYPGLPEQVRSDLLDDEVLSQLSGAVPLIYIRRGDGWTLFSVTDEEGDRTCRTTTTLIDQYTAYCRLYPDPRRIAVLTKLLRPGALGCNPLDNPIISPAQRQHARVAGLEAVLLDARYGIVEEATIPPLPMYIGGTAIWDENDPRIAVPVYAA